MTRVGNSSGNAGQHGMKYGKQKSYCIKTEDIHTS